MTNKEKFLSLATEDDRKTMEAVRYRIANRPWLQAAAEIAWKVLDRLDVLGWTQKDLAEKMSVSQVEISNIVKGTSDLNLSTITLLERVLGIKVIVNE